MIFIV